MHDVLKVNDVYYKNNYFLLPTNENIDKVVENYKIQKNIDIQNTDSIKTYKSVFVIPNLHGCFVHSLIDNVFVYYWILNEIKEKDITFIIITHRILTLKNCNKIFLLEDGKIINHGTFNYLNNNDKIFNQMIKEQEDGF